MHENMMTPVVFGERNKVFTKQSSMAYTLGGRPTVRFRAKGRKSSHPLVGPITLWLHQKLGPFEAYSNSLSSPHLLFMALHSQTLALGFVLHLPPSHVEVWPWIGHLGHNWCLAVNKQGIYIREEDSIWCVLWEESQKWIVLLGARFLKWLALHRV